MAFRQDDLILAARFKALAHPARLAIVRTLLRAGCDGCCCGDVVRELPLAQSTVSQHLRILRDVGLIHGESEGPRCSYRVDIDALASVQAAVGALHAPGAVSRAK